jgi:MFS transporter, OCT family, solute carrier family 22 (organic cation transporter), member 4/5
MEDHEDAAFDKIMELVGNDGKFQKIFNYFFNIALVCFASMSFMNIIMVLNEPGHTCLVPGREDYNLTSMEWRNLTIPV